MSSKIAYDIVGEGEPIIFTHGIGSQKISWNGVVEILKDKYQCITYDLRGHGDTPLPHSNDFYLDDLVDDLENLRSHLRIDKAHLVGHSLGGQIVPRYARKFPDRVITLSLLSTAAFRSKNEKLKILEVIEEIRKKGLDEVLPRLISRWFTDDFIAKNPDAISKRIDQVKKTDTEIFLRVFWIYATCKMEEWLYEIKAPALVMTGENDLACNPDLNKKIAATLDAKLDILKDLRHTITIESGELVGKKIKDFLEKIS